MKYEEFRDAALKYALGTGCSAAETVFVEGDSFRVQVISGEIDTYAVSRDMGLGLRVKIDGRDGYAYTEKFEDPEDLCRRAVDNARSVGIMDDHPMRGAASYASVTPPENPVCDMDERGKIELAALAEKEALAADPRVSRVAYNFLETGRRSVHITNTLGLDAKREGSFSYSYIAPIVEKDGEVHDGLEYRTGADMQNAAAMAADAVADAVAQFGASPVPSGEYRVLFKNIAAASFIEAFVPMFSADNAQKGLSPLKDREGSVIASPLVTITDDPFHPANPRAFDDEGTPSVRKTVVEGGVFRTLLHNLKTAAKAGCDSTSNAARASAASPVAIAPSNFYIEPGPYDYGEMCEKLGDGLIIMEVSGLHSGTNAVTGDFSLLSRGFLVEGGKIVRSVDQITVAGTFLDFLKGIEAVGSDLRFGIPGSKMLGMPSLLVGSLMVAGT